MGNFYNVFHDQLGNIRRVVRIKDVIQDTYYTFSYSSFFPGYIGLQKKSGELTMYLTRGKRRTLNVDA